MKRRIIALLMAASMALTIGASPVLASGGGDDGKCNSGRGNGSEGTPDCDPGNSGGHNNGGD